LWRNVCPEEGGSRFLENYGNLMHCHIREDHILKEAECDIWKIWIEYIFVYWQEVLKFRYQEDLDRAVDLAFGVFHLDIEHCTLALLMQVLPQYLYNRLQWVSTVHFTVTELMYSMKLIVSHLVILQFLLWHLRFLQWWVHNTVMVWDVPLYWMLHQEHAVVFYPEADESIPHLLTQFF